MSLVRAPFAVAVGVLTLAAGCASLIGLDSTTTIPADLEAAPADASTSDVEQDPVDGEVTETIVEACAPSARVAPTKADAVATSSGKTCGLPDAVIAADDVPFGLDYDPASTENALWDERYVTGCVGLTFIGGPFRAVTVRARSASNACGNDCTPMPDSGTGCGTGQWFGLFFRAADGKQKWVTTTKITSSFSEVTVGLPPSVGENPYLYVCRSSSNRTRDDVQVDYVAACP